MRWRLGVGACLASLAVGCDLAPAGPGTVAGAVTGDPELGAAVVEITWEGVQTFDGAGGTQAYWAPVQPGPDRFRVVLVDPVGGDLRFELDVDDLHLEGPIVTVVSAADTANQPMPVADLRVRLER